MGRSCPRPRPSARESAGSLFPVIPSGCRSPSRHPKQLSARPEAPTGSDRDNLNPGPPRLPMRLVPGAKPCRFNPVPLLRVVGGGDWSLPTANYHGGWYPATPAACGRPAPAPTGPISVVGADPVAEGEPSQLLVTGVAEAVRLRDEERRPPGGAKDRKRVTALVSVQHDPIVTVEADRPVGLQLDQLGQDH